MSRETFKTGRDVKEIDGFLEQNKNKAWTVVGLMIEKFGITSFQQGSKPFNEWKRDDVKLYNDITKRLNGLVDEGKVLKRKVGKPNFYLWEGE